MKGGLRELLSSYTLYRLAIWCFESLCSSLTWAWIRLILSYTSMAYKLHYWLPCKPKQRVSMAAGLESIGRYCSAPYLSHSLWQYTQLQIVEWCTSCYLLCACFSSASCLLDLLSVSGFGIALPFPAIILLPVPAATILAIWKTAKTPNPATQMAPTAVIKSIYLSL